MLTQTQFMYMAVPAIVAVGGGILAMVWRPDAVTRSLIQHFAAGVVLAALAVELLPEISREHAPPWVTIAAFAAGSLFMYGLKLWTARLEHQDELKAEAAHASGRAVAAAMPMGLVIATLTTSRSMASSSAPASPPAATRGRSWRSACRWRCCFWA